MNTKLLSELLLDIEAKKPIGFTGTGIIVYNDITKLPIFPLLSNTAPYILPISNYDSILAALLEISDINHPYHDGFHLLSERFELTHISQYFSTPIVKNQVIIGNHGSRYLTAFYGSFIVGVDQVGIVTNNCKPTIFRSGSILPSISVSMPYR